MDSGPRHDQPGPDASHRPLQPATIRSSKLWTYGWLTVIFLIVGGLLVSFVYSWNYEASKSGYRERLKQIAIAINQYHDDFGCFPPAYTVDADGRQLQSWRVLILPQLGQQELFRQVHLNEPWDSPHNKQFHNRRPAIYGHTYVKDTVAGETHMFAVVGRETLWPEQYSAKITDIDRGTSNSGMLVEYSSLEVNWMEPRDLTRKIVRTKVFPAGSNQATGAFRGVFIAFADGAVRLLHPSINRQLASAFFSIRAGNRPLDGVTWPAADDPEMPALPEARPASDFARSEVVPVLKVKLSPATNIVYCAAFQIAWDEIQKLAKGRPQFDRSAPFVDELNLKAFPKSELDSKSYVAVGGRMADNVIGQIEAALREKFPQHKRTGISASPDAVIFYAYLFKQLPFGVDFERFGIPLEFRHSNRVSKVEGFGVDSLRDVGGRLVAMLEQVQILDHVSDDDFILKLRTQARRDEIYLAKVQPSETLEETFESVQKRIDSPANNGFRTELGGGDRLFVPVLQLSVDRSYDELVGLNFQNPSLRGLFISEARQILKFRLDETGAIVESEAVIIGENGDSHVETPYDSKKPRQLVFDRPFLLFVRETQAKAPYLVMWIANDELMEPSQK